jgi:CHAT domain-containing protein
MSLITGSFMQYGSFNVLFMMRKCITFIILFQCLFVHSQQLESEIYNALDTFINNQNEISLQVLNKQEKVFKNKVTTKEEHLALVILQCNKAYYLKQKNSIAKAILTYGEAWERFSKYKLSNYDITEYCLKPLGNLYTITKDYTNAVNTIKQYIFLAEKDKNTIQRNAGIINLSVVYHNIGNYQTAISLLKKALQTPNLNEKQKGLLQNNLTTNLIALKRYNEAQTLIEGNSLSGKNRLNFYKNASQIELQKGNYQKAQFYFNQAKEIAYNQKDISARAIAKLYVDESQLLVQSNHQDKALKSLLNAIKTLLPNFSGNGLPNKEILYSENTFIDIFDLYAEIQTDSNRKLESYNLSFYVSSLLQEDITSQEAKILNQINDRNRSEKCIEILFQTYTKTPNNQLLISAFQYAENSKASVLKEILQKKSLQQQYPKDSLLIRQQQLLQQQERITNGLIKEQLGNAKSSNVNDLSQQLSSVSFQLKMIKKNILEKYSKYRKRSISIIKLQGKLQRDKAVLVEYFYGKHAIYQFVISSDSLSFKEINLNRNTKEAISNFIDFFDDASIINNNVNDYTTQAFNSYNLLKFNEVSIYKNVVIIPDGLLNFIPFEALLTSKVATAKFSKMPFVVKKQAIAYNSSALFYLKENKKNKNQKVLGIFPVFENTSQKLSYSIDEAEAIKKEIASTLLMKDQALKSSFIKSAPNYGILHLSTHASSGNFTVPANIEFYDKNMMLNELYELDLNPNLVVLSACETGVGKLQKGEGVMSIARGFQYAGAQNILFSLWQINDQATSIIMSSFYKNYNNKQSAYIANRDAKIAYLENENISNIKKSPYYWSAFVYYGELIPPTPQNKSYLYIISLMILLFLTFLAIKYFKKLIK